MSIDKYYQLVEESLGHLGLNAEDARCAEDGQWLVFRSDIEIYIDVWKEPELNEWMYFPDAANTYTFQVAAPISQLPAEDKKSFFYEDLLQMNQFTQFASFVINKEQNMLTANFRRVTENLSKSDIIEAIEAIGYYADLAWKMLNQPYDLKKP